jgi:hypothetical protein
MKGYPPSEEYKVDSVEDLKTMGIFGKDVQQITVNQAANGSSATAEVEVKIPLWEVVLVCTLTAIVVFALYRACQKGLKSVVAQQIQRARTMEALNEI